MAKKARFPSTKRFGPRYGKTVKDKYGKLESSQKKSYSCPKCGYDKVKRQGLGIWECSKCGTKFAGRAYSLS